MAEEFVPQMNHHKYYFRIKSMQKLWNAAEMHASISIDYIIISAFPKALSLSDRTSLKSPA